MAENNPVIDSEESAKNLAKHILNAEKSSRDFVENFKDALSFTKQLNNAMERVYDNIAKNGEKIGKNKEILKKIEQSITSNRAKDAMLEASINQRIQERVNLNNQLLEIQNELKNIEDKEVWTGADLSKEYNQLIKTRAALTRNLQINERETNKEIEKRNQLGNHYNKSIERKNKLESDNSGLESVTNLLKSQILLIKLIQLGYERFVKLDAAAESFRKQTGFSNTQMVELRKNAESINVEFQDMGVGITEVYTSAKALTDVFGRTSLVSREAMQNVSLMSVNLGVAAEDSANVLATFQGLGGATQEVAMNVMKVGAGFSEKAGIPFSLVMKDIANASEQTTAMLGANPSKLMKSAIAARALGTDLNKIVSSQRKLLDFSSSINEELEASALLGRSISFQKARQLAYDGDIEGAAKATLAAVKAAGNFNEMNVYQREALAKASGMELKDLTKMMTVDAQRQEIELRGTDEQKAKLKMQTEALEKLKEENDLSKEGLLAEGERAIRQQKMQGIMTKLKNTMDSIVVSLGDILEPIITALATTVVPIFKVIASIAKVLSPFFKGLLAPIQFIAEAIGGWADSLSNFMDESKGVADFFKNDLVKGILGTLGAGGMLAYLFFGKGGPRSLMTMIAKPFKAVVSMAKDIFTNATKKGLVGDFIGPKLPSSVDEVGKISKATKGVKSGTEIKDFLSNLATGLAKMGTGKVFAGAFNLGATGVAFVAMTAGIVGFAAIALGGAAAGAGLTALSIGLSSLANPAALKGTGILALISLSFIGLAYAGKLAADAFASIAKAIPDAIGPFIKFALISPLLYGAAGAISALSLSLALFAGASIGGKLVSFFAGDPFEKFQKLADLSERLKMSADAMKDISIAATSFVSINAFADSISKLADSLGRLNDQLGAIKSEELSKLSQAASATTAPNTTTPTANTTLNTSGIEAKLDTLTNLLTGGAVRVYLDGKDVSSAMSGIGR